MKKIKANANSYDSHKKRNRNDIKYIVIHYTGGVNDTARNNCLYFKCQTERKAGAHFFIDDKECIKSVPMNRTAWSVGGFYTKNNGAGKYYKECTNYNSVSIEVCNWTEPQLDINTMINIRKCINYIKKYCKNANTIIRHWDVNGKSCPYPIIGTNNIYWKKLKNFIN